MAKRKPRYREGDWFAVPLKRGGWGIGRIARGGQESAPILFGYFFGPVRNRVPSLDELEAISPEQAVMVCRFGDPGLQSGQWPIIGQGAEWNREDWPMPPFRRVDGISGKVALIEYHPENLVWERELPHIDPSSIRNLPRDGLDSWGSVEIVMDMLLRGESIPEEPIPSAMPPAGDRDPYVESPIDQLRRAGSDVSRPHVFEFYLYFPKKASARDVAAQLASEGYQTNLSRSDDDDQWLVLASRELTPQEFDLNKYEEKLRQLASLYRGEYDGWQAGVKR